jgi:phosphatidylinositol alpha 1,6-mannosyltransferase
VDTARFGPAKRSAKLRAGLAPRSEVLAGYVGRLAVEKRVDLLSQVAMLPGVRLVIVGSGPAEAAIRRAVPSALYLGQRSGDDLARIYASLDVFVHSGPYDTFGQTLQEAAASGLPVVAPAAGGPLDLVRDGRTGFLVRPDDAGALAAAVARLAGDAGLRAAQGTAGRSVMLDRSWAVKCDELIGHYHDLLGRADTPQPAAVAA